MNKIIKWGTIMITLSPEADARLLADIKKQHHRHTAKNAGYVS